MSDTPAIRTAVREWARAAAAGELDDLSWVDTDLSPRAKPHRVVQGEDGETRFGHLPYTAFLPAPMADAMQAAQEQGEVSAMEAVMLLFARPEWLMVARPLLWSPLSPEPRLLAWLVERWGIEPALHRDDPQRLARIAARLPRWQPQRGRLGPAVEMVADGAGEPLNLHVVDRSAGPAPRSPDLRQELFTCRSDRWWAARAQLGARPKYRIEGGVLRHQPKRGPVFELLREDVLIGLRGDIARTRRLIRLLPAWASVRLVPSFSSGNAS